MPESKKKPRRRPLFLKKTVRKSGGSSPLPDHCPHFCGAIVSVKIIWKNQQTRRMGSRLLSSRTGLLLRRGS